MGWLQKMPQTSEPKSFYTIGLNQTILLVGLGNPGKQYDLTRHNIGFFCIDKFVETTPELNNWLLKKDFKAHVSQGSLNDKRIIAIKPTTFMNLSGEAIALVAGFYHILPENILVIHDDQDIKFGQIRTRLGGSSAGHNGIKSISQAIGENYGRIRVGIGPKPEQMDLKDFVLQKFSSSEQSQLNSLTKEVANIIQEYIFDGALPHDTRNFII